MLKKNVPQDVGLAGPMREVIYAVGQDGAYEAVPSYGWDSKTVALNQAWDLILKELEAVKARVAAGELSPLAWHMTRHQMQPALLAKYARINRWRVKRHLKAGPFSRLKPAVLARYAEALGIPVADLKTVPDAPDLEFTTNRNDDANPL
ncbi:MAG: hypothetical protein HF981_07895 [Desulfobacteraceae bacterium]|nr:hypothetical protein [Desulfobacteraceae bacterium]MBC2750290.1 hypothetical protein [Desulfobacteraceae bacterium]